MNEKTRKLIMFLLLHGDMEVRWGQSVERSTVMEPDNFAEIDGVIFLDTYEGM